MKPQTFYIFTLGCAKNEFDSYRLSRKLEKLGLKQVEAPEDAELVILNTCSFIEDAVYETVEVARSLKKRIKKGQKFIVAGCAVNYFGEKINRLIKADLYLSTACMQHPEKILYGSGGEVCLDGDEKVESPQDFETAQERKPSAYLKVAEGCSNRCSYCLIPEIRGPLKSIPVEIVAAEAERLVKSGVKELNLIAQDLSSYGTDLYGRPYLKELAGEILKRLESFDFWLRLMYVNPDKVDFEMLAEILEMDKVVPYLELPVQSGSKKVLEKMNRKRNPEFILENLKRLKKLFPELAVRTTFLVGFPGETEDDFEATVNMLNEMRPDYVYVFGYSDMEGSASFGFEGKLKAEEITARVNYLSELAYKIMEEKAVEKEGTKVRVLVERRCEDGLCGRAHFQAPEVDGEVFLEGKAASGFFVTARLKSSIGVDFRGEVAGDDAQ